METGYNICITLTMRGQSLFQDLFTNNVTAAEKAPVKGRCKELSEKRDELLINRYFYYGRTVQVRYEIIVATLANEFFLTERRIQDIIIGHSEKLRDIRNAPPSVQELRKRWPHLNWN